jgi:hypothetical protein
MASGGRPKWQLTNTPQSGFVVGAVWLSAALLDWIRVAVGHADALVVAAAVIPSLLGGAYIASSVALRRHEVVEHPSAHANDLRDMP